MVAGERELNFTVAGIFVFSARNPTLNARAPPLVVDCGLPVMKDHCYWPLVSDLNNVLSHRPVAVQFMNNDTLTNMWFSFLSYFQGTRVLLTYYCDSYYENSLL